MILRNFIVFEGIDGTGTTTQIDRLKERFATQSGLDDMPVHCTCEPTTGEIGKLIRRALSGEIRLTEDAMARLFAADRGEHLDGPDGIRAKLAAGLAVISDRYLFSSLAYQANAGQTLPHELNRDFPLPEYLFYFDIDPQIAMDRVENRQGTLEIYEKRDFQHKVRTRYLEIIADYEKAQTGMNIIRIDATRTIDSITENIWSIVRNLPKI